MSTFGWVSAGAASARRLRRWKEFSDELALQSGRAARERPVARGAPDRAGRRIAARRLAAWNRPHARGRSRQCALLVSRGGPQLPWTRCGARRNRRGSQVDRLLEGQLPLQWAAARGEGAAAVDAHIGAPRACACGTAAANWLRSGESEL